MRVTTIIVIAFIFNNMLFSLSSFSQANNKPCIISNIDYWFGSSIVGENAEDYSTLSKMGYSPYTDIDTLKLKNKNLDYVFNYLENKSKIIGYYLINNDDCVKFINEISPLRFNVLFKQNDSIAIDVIGVLDTNVYLSHIDKVAFEELKSKEKYKITFSSINIEKYFQYWSKYSIVRFTDREFNILEMEFPNIFKTPMPESTLKETHRKAYHDINERNVAHRPYWEFEYEFDSRKFYGVEIRDVLKQVVPNDQFFGAKFSKSNSKCDSTGDNRQCFELYYKNSDTTALIIRGYLPLNVVLPEDETKALEVLMQQKYHWLGFYTVDVQEFLRLMELEQSEKYSTYDELCRWNFYYSSIEKAYPNLVKKNTNQDKQP